MNKILFGDKSEENEVSSAFGKLSDINFLFPIDAINSEKQYTCDFGLNQEGNSVVGDISMLAY